jgi:hypothetical protein
MTDVAEADPAALLSIPDLVRCEEYDREAIAERITELTHTVYRHEQIYGDFVTIHAHIDCPPDDVYAYMSNPFSLVEWTYSVRELRPTATPGLLVGVDASRTPIYCRTVANSGARTVDYHCAWDQSDELWMVYLNRVLPAETVLKKPGSVIVWTNCRHPYYEKNPFPDLCDDPKRDWVGDWWPLFYGGHTLELLNLKNILEYRHHHHIPIGPYLRRPLP